ncbi:MAG: hypothetical protein RL607_1301 [Bacteroidota bacterium]|jgi:hypothetical protein
MEALIYLIVILQYNYKIDGRNENRILYGFTK